MATKLISLNVEQDKHTKRVLGFLQREGADMVALMEVYESDYETILKDYPYRVFAPNCQSLNGKNWGVAWGSKYALTHETFYADGNETAAIPLHGTGTHRPLMVKINVTKEGQDYQLSAVHFTWTEGGQISNKQREDFARLIDKFRGQEIVMCGDFNLPRRQAGLPGSNEIYDKMAQIYKDNIPPEITSTIDPKLHRANFEENGKLALMVDYVWSTPTYEVSEVKIVEGVSDHCALVCLVDKV